MVSATPPPALMAFKTLKKMVSPQSTSNVIVPISSTKNRDNVPPRKAQIFTKDRSMYEQHLGEFGVHVEQSIGNVCLVTL